MGQFLIFQNQGAAGNVIQQIKKRKPKFKYKKLVISIYAGLFPPVRAPLIFPAPSIQTLHQTPENVNGTMRIK